MVVECVFVFSCSGQSSSGWCGEMQMTHRHTQWQWGILSNEQIFCQHLPLSAALSVLSLQRMWHSVLPMRMRMLRVFGDPLDAPQSCVQTTPACSCSIILCNQHYSLQSALFYSLQSALFSTTFPTLSMPVSLSKGRRRIQNNTQNFDNYYLIFYLFLPAFLLKQLGWKWISLVFRETGFCFITITFCCISINPGADKSLCQEDRLRVSGTNLIFASWVNGINNCHFNKFKYKKPAQTKRVNPSKMTVHDKFSRAMKIVTLPSW